VQAATQASPNAPFNASVFRAEQPQHTVQISRQFYVARHEVTQEQYQKIVGKNPSYFSATGEGSGKVNGSTSRYPVEHVSWYDAVEFCNKLSASEDQAAAYRIDYTYDQATNFRESVLGPDGSITWANVDLTGNNGYRLLTEAEWEYCCRANTTTAFNFGSALNGTKANVNGGYPFGTSPGNNLGRTTNVGSYPKNAFGLYDMHGNVWEWCYDELVSDVYSKRSGVTVDPGVKEDGSLSGREPRVLRGGSWDFYGRAAYARSAYRNYMAPAYRKGFYGFRIAFSVAPQTAPGVPNLFPDDNE